MKDKEVSRRSKAVQKLMIKYNTTSNAELRRKYFEEYGEEISKQNMVTIKKHLLKNEITGDDVNALVLEYKAKLSQEEKDIRTVLANAEGSEKIHYHKLLQSVLSKQGKNLIDVLDRKAVAYEEKTRPVYPITFSTTTATMICPKCNTQFAWNHDSDKYEEIEEMEPSLQDTNNVKKSVQTKI